MTQGDDPQPDKLRTGEGVSFPSPGSVSRNGGGPSTTQKGYGYRHQVLRKRWAGRVELGGVKCARCGELISPLEPWDLGHVDGSKTKYNGPEHARCNRATKARPVKRFSREW